MKNILFKLLLILTLAPFAMQAVPKTSHDFFDAVVNTEHYNIFHEGIYDEWYKQLQAFVVHEMKKHKEVRTALRSMDSNNFFQEKTLGLIRSTLQPLKSNPYDKSKFHEFFIATLRELIVQKESVDEKSDMLTIVLATFLDDLTNWMFTAPKITIPAEAYLLREAFLNKKTITEAFHIDPQNVFVNFYNDFASNPRFNMVDWKSMLHDPIHYGDLPSHLFHLPSDKRVQFIRMPNPIRDVYIDVEENTILPRVNEEFKNHLIALGRKGKKQLYVNLMGKGSTANPRPAFVEQLELDPQLKPSLIVISLDKGKDSNFYFQTNEYEEISSAEEFKQLFLERLFNPHAYYWSEHMDLPYFKQRFERIIEEVHFHFYDGKSELDCNERKDFIELVYVKIVEALIDHFHPDVVNLTCKQTVDRGPSLYTLLYFHELLKTGQSLTGHEMEIFDLYFIPPYTLHNRAGHGFRVTRLQGAFNKLLEKGVSRS